MCKPGNGYPDENSDENLGRYKVTYDDSFDKTLVLDGIPQIDKSKVERLLTKVCKEFSRKGVSLKAEDIFMPWDDAKGKSKGCVLESVTCYTMFTDFQIRVRRFPHR